MMGQINAKTNPTSGGVTAGALAGQESQSPEDTALELARADYALLIASYEAGFKQVPEGEVCPALYYKGRKVVSGSELAEASEAYVHTPKAQRKPMEEWAQEVVALWREEVAEE
jgi:hypothetical protein